ncbi:polyprenyl synthetase family protein [uncultured Microbacterium sp.]|uniref:polyprenyl synthetase family protein n=1 Tax=uncultured Microbacterium sp. TaxID=191216 RepID=UPI0025DEFA94|nr:polyprenyl synthetase family protein [uncultured Microbacterium sp.]
MHASADPIEAISQRLARFVTAQRLAWADAGPEAQVFLDAATRTLAGGKRLRARFCVTGWLAVAGVDTDVKEVPDSVLDAAAALEVFHAAALVHDDIIDNSDTRRGQPAAHRALEAAHTGSGWVGEGSAFGRSAAILLGDLLVAWSDDLLEQGLARAPHAASAREVYALMRREVTIGQFLDIAEEAAFTTAPDEEHAERALRVASLKSARYSIQHPLLVGAALAGADATQSAALAAFGHPLGLAFQLRDDVLGVFGDTAVTGKPSGDDLREGKRTLLIAYTREALAPDDRAALDALIGDPALTAEQIAQIQQCIIDTDALARVESAISAYAGEAEHALHSARLSSSALDQLRELADASISRTA